jgi:acetylglutamate kinase
MTATPHITVKNAVIKIGGSTLGAHDTTLSDLAALQRQGVSPVVVHGGGPVVTAWLKRQGVEAPFVRGLRTTTAESLEVVTAVLAGLVNTELVAGILAAGGRAVGMSGVDGGLIEAHIENADLGYVGQVTHVRTHVLETLLSAGYMPVIATVGYNSKAESGPTTLNLNADTVAGEIAAALGAERLVFLTDVEGVLDAGGALLPHLTPPDAKRLIASGTASGGMIPKLEACLRARSGGCESWIVDGRVEHMLLSALSAEPTGTQVW